MILAMAEHQRRSGDALPPGLEPSDHGRAAPPGALACLKAAGLRSVWMVRGEDGDLRTVKTWPLGALTALKWLIGLSQPQRHRRGARRLREVGISTPPLLRGPRIVRRGGALLLELELEYIEGATGMELLRAGDAERTTAAGTAVAELLRRLLRAGLFNRDLKLSNVLLRRTGSGWEAWLLDPVALRPLRDLRRQGTRMLERLAVEPREEGITLPQGARRVVVAALRDALLRRD